MHQTSHYRKGPSRRPTATGKKARAIAVTARSPPPPHRLQLPVEVQRRAHFHLDGGHVQAAGEGDHDNHREQVRRDLLLHKIEGRVRLTARIDGCRDLWHKGSKRENRGGDSIQLTL